MLAKTISVSDRFARYFFSLVIGNHIFGLFVTLSMYRDDGIDFFALLLFVLVVAHATTLVCLLAIDLVHVIARLLKTRHAPNNVVNIITVFVALWPALWIGYMVGDGVAKLLAYPWRPQFVDIIRPGILFGTLVTALALFLTQWVKNMRRHYEQESALLIAERHIIQARFDLLAKELHPHLLFNVIQNVLSLMSSDVGAAKIMLQDLAVYYQEVLLVIDKTAITLDEELTLCKHYMAVQQRRFSNVSLAIDDQTSGRTHSFLLPPLLLQPLLENAIKYSFDDRDKAVTILLVVTQQQNSLQIVISNPSSASGGAASPGFSRGLKNSKERMIEFFGDRAKLALTRDVNKTFVTLDLPYAPN